MDSTRFSLAERALTVAHQRLGNRPKKEAPYRRVFHQGRDEHRNGLEPHTPGEKAISRHERERPIGGGNQPPRERDALDLIALQQLLARALSDDGGQLPSKIHGVADPRVHSLPANGAVDVRCITQEECPAAPEMIRYAMVNFVGREPIDLVHSHLHLLQHLRAHIVPSELLVMLLRLASHGSDEAGSAVSLQREDCQQIGFVERDVELVVRDLAMKLDVGNVEDPFVGAAGKTDAEHFTNA